MEVCNDATQHYFQIKARIMELFGMDSDRNYFVFSRKHEKKFQE